MNTKIKLLLLVLICSTKILAQNSAFILTPHYKIVDNAGLFALPIFTPATTDPTVGYFANFKAKKSQNIQVNNEGEIMFFIVDAHVYDRKGKSLGGF